MKTVTNVLSALALATFAAAAPALQVDPVGNGGGLQRRLPTHALVGYLHASFANGAGYIPLANVSNDWDIINLSFGEPTSSTSGDIRFNLCPVTECPGVESEAAFIAAVDSKKAAGKLVQLSIGGQNGLVRLETTAARDTFVSSVSTILTKFHLSGLDIDFEGHSLSLDTADVDFRSPTTAVIVNLIAALKSLKTRHPTMTLTFAPETLLFSIANTFYGTGPWGGQDPRCGAYLPVIHALRDDITMLHVQNYNSGPIMGLDGQYWQMGTSDFHVAMADISLKGFNAAGNASRPFVPLRPDQIGFGVPSSVSAGNGYVEPSVVQAAVNCIVKGTSCGSYKPSKTYPGLRGVMAWSINWDKFYGDTFRTSMRPFLNAL